MRIDPFFERQPAPKFIEDLSSPVHKSAPLGFGNRRERRDGEACVSGLFLKNKFPEGDEWLKSAYDDFLEFLSVTKVGGDRYPLSFVKGSVAGSESFILSVGENCATVTCEDTESVRRALVFIEEEMTRREGAFLPLGVTERRAYIRRRMTRGFFSPTNRAPKFGDELLDDIEYYPDEYLNRLAHNGTNGLWIYTSFRALIDMPEFEQNSEEVSRRIQKLSRVVYRCKRYGLKVYVFAIEPFGLTSDEAAEHPGLVGAVSSNGMYSTCMRKPEARECFIGAVERLFKTIPELGGLISITAGERLTSCPSTAMSYRKCPICSKYDRGENLAYVVDCMKEGIRRAGTGADFISWTYSHRYWDEENIISYVRNAPRDVVLMQNFEDGGINEQLGKPRIALDYWLSYVGPCEKFALTAQEAKKRGCEMWAKLQVCNSHELATVPYIPVPGILYDKYKTLRELGTSGVMECWYFGNYPSLMSRASGALSFLDKFESKEAFLLDYAARLYGESRAPMIVEAWRAFEDGYKNYPTNVMFNYYGPMHDGVVWKLSLLPKNNPLSRTWLLQDVPDGDRIGECLYRGHTLDEAITLSERICENWKRGISILSLPEETELMTLSRALGVLFSSGLNILKFYRLRAMLGKEEGDAKSTLDKMRELAETEIENSRKMIGLCAVDSRLGYHSEAEGFKFFPEKLEDRIESLENMLREEFPVVEKRILDGRSPLGYYYAEGEQSHKLGEDLIPIDEKRAFSLDKTEDGVVATVICPRGNNVSLDYEFDLFMPECGIIVSESPMYQHGESLSAYPPGIGLSPFATSHQSLFGDSINEELSHHRLEREELSDGMMRYRIFTSVPQDRWNRRTAIRLRITVGGAKWISSPDPVLTLGRASTVADEYGFFIP